MQAQETRIAVLVSGGGSNLQAIMDSIAAGKLPGARIVKVIASRSDAYALERAAEAAISTCVISTKDYPNEGEKTRTLLRVLSQSAPDLIVLAGYMSVLGPEIIERYPRRIINIHPSLIPKYCGKGFYGERVHKAVIAAGEKVSGATVHFVDEGVDTGDIILQRQVPVQEGDDHASLAARVLGAEHELLPEAISLFCRGKLP